MKERLLDVVKWGLVLIIAGAVFYVVCPKYYFGKYHGGHLTLKGNKITGKVEYFVSPKGGWIELCKEK